MKNTIITKENNFYYFSTNKFVLFPKDSLEIGRDIIPNIDFPEMSKANTGYCNLCASGGFYSNSNPFYDIVMIGSLPYLLTLNSEEGKKVNIPFLSNCDIVKDLQTK